MKLSTKILLAFILILVLSIIETGSNYILSIKIRDNSDLLSKSQDMIRNSPKLHNEMISTQSALRGFLLSNDSIFLAEYQQGLDDILLLLSEQRKLVSKNTLQSKLSDSIEYLHQQWLNYADTILQPDKHFYVTSKSLSNSPLENFEIKRQFGKEIKDRITSAFANFDKRVDRWIISFNFILLNFK